jgi:hypothetical protein
VTDTPDAVAAIMRTRLQQKSGEERLYMGFSMFDSAKAMMLASVAILPASEKRKMIFLRLYGNEFDSERIKKLLDHLARF